MATTIQHKFNIVRFQGHFCLQQLQVQFGTINNMNECYMKMSTVVYSIKQQKKSMCFLLPVDSKPTADKMSINKSKATFEIEQC
jgi:hypothetical protein